MATVELPVTAEDHRIARLAAAAIALSLVDAAIPLPLPGIKPGLANIVVLVVLWRYGWGTAAWVSLLRVFAGSTCRAACSARSACPSPPRSRTLADNSCSPAHGWFRTTGSGC
jgi:hypothetical protein